MRGRSFAAAWTQLRVYPARIVAVVLAIVLGVGFVAATVVFGATYRASLGDAVSARYVGTDVVITDVAIGDVMDDVSPNADDSHEQLLDRITALPGVEHAEFQPQTWPTFAATESRGTLALDTFPADPRLRWFGLVTGAWPAAPEQILIDQATADSANLQVGSSILLSEYSGGSPAAVTVSGIADTAASAFSGAQYQGFSSASLIAELSPSGASGPIVVIGEPDILAEQLRNSIAAAVPPGLTVLTSAEQTAKSLAQVTGGATVLTIVLLGFAIVAVLAAGIVIANTFTILLAQRRRYLALIRCVGGSSGQVRREVLAEAVLVGTIGSFIGIAVGSGVGALGAGVAGLDQAGPVLPVLPLVLIGLGGIGFTMLAAFAPASRAMRIAPLAALRPVSDEAEQRRFSAVRLSVAGVLTGLGLLLLAAAVAVPSLLLGMAGGVLSACGILLLTGTFLPATVRFVGRLGAIFGPPGRLAAANAHRNPGRAAATTAALMLGVGLIVTLQVGTSSAQASLDRALSERYPVDVAVSSSGAALPPTIVAAVGGVDGISGTGELRGATVNSVKMVGSRSNDGSITDGITILGVSQQAAATLTGPVPNLADDTVIVPSYLLSAGLSVGDRITVETASGSGEFTVAAGALASQGINGDSLITTAAGLDRLAPDAPILAVWAAVDSGADLQQVAADLNRIIVAQPDLVLGGSAPERAAAGSALGTIVTLATALLAVAVIIAIVGIGNTLGLSVVERTRESALLRALGLQRRQLRLMLAVEAALLAGVGATVGLLAGIGYGWVGVASAFGESGEATVLRIPWGQLGAVLLLAVVAALIASVLPARRAARATPTQALADV